MTERAVQLDSVVAQVRASALQTTLQAVADALYVGHTQDAIAILSEAGVWPDDPSHWEPPMP